MSALSDQLNQHLDKMDAEGGLSTLHLLSLPSSINRVLRLFLRSKQIPYQDIRAAVASMPEDSRLSQEELDEMLDLLCQRDWLIRTQDGEVVYYGINLRPAVASASAKAGSADPTASDAMAKADLDSVAPARSSGDLHAAITGKTEEKKPDNQKSKKKAEPSKSEEKDSERGHKPVTADDLWDILD